MCFDTCPTHPVVVPCKSFVVGAFQLWKTLVLVTRFFWLIFIALFVSSLQILCLSFPHARTVIYPSSVLHFAMPYGLHAFVLQSHWLPGLTTTRSSKEKLWNSVCVLGYFASFTLCDSPSPLLPNWWYI